MNLQPVTDTHGQTVTCFCCRRRVALASCVADLDGPAFKAYYCPDCKPEPCRECGAPGVPVALTISRPPSSLDPRAPQEVVGVTNDLCQPCWQSIYGGAS